MMLTDRPPQKAIAWSEARWQDAFPELADVLGVLPNPLSRPDVRAVATRAETSPQAATEAFVTTMIWGYGNRGYGPWRTRHVLGQGVEAAERLASVARILAADGAVAAYGALGTHYRIKWLGPAFGTKYLHFCPQSQCGPPALILDRLVSDWLRREVGVKLSPVPWSVDTYSSYVHLLAGWAEELHVPPDAIEEHAFTEEASRRGSQWADRRSAA